MSRNTKSTAAFLCRAFLALLCSPACAWAVAVSPPSGIVGWWPGDGTAVDLITGNNGMLVGATCYAESIVDQGFHFPGAGAVNVPDSSALDRAFLTMEAWISPEMLPATPGARFTIATKGISLNSSENYGLYLTNAGLMFECFSAG